MEQTEDADNSRAKHYQELNLAISRGSSSSSEPFSNHEPEDMRFQDSHVSYQHFVTTTSFDSHTGELASSLAQSLISPVECQPTDVKAHPTLGKQRVVLKDAAQDCEKDGMEIAEQAWRVATNNESKTLSFQTAEGRIQRLGNGNLRQNARNRRHEYDPFPSTNKTVHRCTTCGKTFKRAHNLKIHSRLHTGDRPYVCPFDHCRKDFRWKSSVVSHINWHRTRQGDILHGDINKHIIVKNKQNPEQNSPNLGKNGRIVATGQQDQNVERVSDTILASLEDLNEAGAKRDVLGRREGEPSIQVASAPLETASHFEEADYETSSGDEQSHEIHGKRFPEAMDYQQDGTGYSEATIQKMMAEMTHLTSTHVEESSKETESDAANTPSTTVESSANRSPPRVELADIDRLTLFPDMEASAQAVDDALEDHEISTSGGMLLPSLSSCKNQPDTLASFLEPHVEEM